LKLVFLPVLHGQNNSLKLNNTHYEKENFFSGPVGSYCRSYERSFCISPGRFKDKKVIADSKIAREEFIKTDGMMKNLFSNSYGYVIFPNVGKGAIGVGGAAGNGVAYEKGTVIGMAKMKQVTVGFQWGGQAYREVIFFENKDAMDRFKQNRIELSAQISAVAATAGASANAKYTNGVMVFTQQKGGLMYEASIGGQKLSFRKI
jgi:lipid-binding SYLF domain-containing protein